jgi:metallo-beta-lactamase family protein
MVIVAAFAVGPAQALLHAICQLKAGGTIPDLPVFLNSPMAIDMTEIYSRHRGEHRLTERQCEGMCAVARMMRTEEESRALNGIRYPAVIISASGMATGGCVLHHLKKLAPDARNAIVFPGFQAPGTRDARLLEGERSVRIFGEPVGVHAEVIALPGYSAHADADQVPDWMRGAPQPPRLRDARRAGSCGHAAQRIEHELAWAARAPEYRETVDLAAP